MQLMNCAAVERTTGPFETADVGGTLCQLTAAEIAEAVALANVPVLLMLVFQVTGDERWLRSPYLPTRGKGLLDHDTGGLPENIQAEIREAAIAAVARLQSGAAPSIPVPSPELLVRMMSVFMGEDVGSEYGPMLSSEFARRMGFEDEQTKGPDVAPPPGFKVIVIGTGIAGIAAAQQLEQMGVDYVILDKQAGPGGNWLQSTYPGAGVDTPSHLYSFSFSKNDWRLHFALRDELQEYFNRTLRDVIADRPVRFNTEVIAATYQPGTQTWRVDVRNGSGAVETLTANVVISAVGVLNRAKWPKLPGLQRFAGSMFHSSDWPEDIDLTGKRVAVVGTGASSMQIVSAIAGRVGHLTVFQRSPQWVAPFDKFQLNIPEPLRLLLQSVNLYHVWYWLRLFWQFGDKVIEALRKDPAWPHPERAVNARNDGHRQYFTRYIEEQLRGREDLLAKVMPDYPPFGKRILLDNGWYRVLRQDNVTLVNEAVAEVREDGLVSADGSVHGADVVIWATGFEAARFVSSMNVIGLEGASLREVWNDDDPHAFLGISVPQFPNFFMLGGPNSFPGSGSFMFFMEVQMRYLRGLMNEMFAKDIAAVHARADVTKKYSELVDRLHEETVWSHPGMDTYYRNSRGRVVFVMPFLNVEYWNMVRRVNLDDYVLHSASQGAVDMSATQQPRLGDIEDIRSLIADYAYRLDMNQTRELVELFVEDCEVSYGPGFGAVGIDAYAKTLEGVGSFFQATSHHVSNIVVDFTGDDTANVRTVLYAWHRYRKERPDGHLWGQYHDVVVRRDGRWLFKRRELRTTGVKDFHVKVMHPIGRQ